jgi:hypothetical protein
MLTGVTAAGSPKGRKLVALAETTPGSFSIPSTA